MANLEQIPRASALPPMHGDARGFIISVFFLLRLLWIIARGATLPTARASARNVSNSSLACSDLKSR